MTLPRLVGLRTAKELIFIGRLVDADEVAELDFVNIAVADEKLGERVADLLSRLANQPTGNLGLAKQVIHDNLGASWRDSLQHEARI